MWAYSNKHVRVILLGAILALGGPGSASVVRAEPTAAQIKAAKSAYSAGLALEAAGDYAQALQRFREVIAVKTTPQALFHIARCLEKLGKWTEAVGTYRMAVEKADAPSETSVREQADSARAALENKLPKIVIERGRGAEAATFTLDGVELGATSIGSPMPADPGPHVITASAPGKPTAKFDLSLTEGEVRRLPVDMAAAPIPSASTSATATVAPVPTASEKTFWTRRNGFYVGGAGAAFLIAGTVFLVMRQTAVADLDDKCWGGHCPANMESTYDRSKVYTILADSFLGVGAVGAGLGAWMIFKGRREDPSQGATAGKTWLAPLGPGGLGASVGGVF